MIYQLETGRALRDKKDLHWAREKNPEKQFQIFINTRGDKLMKKYLTSILPWRDEKNVESFDFNVLKVLPLKETRRLAKAVNKNLTDKEIRQIAVSSFEKKTQTLSKKKDRTEYWNTKNHHLIDALIEKYQLKY